MVFTYSIFSRSEITCKSREDSMFYIKFYQELFIISKGHITSTNKTLVMIFTLLTDGGLVTKSCPTLCDHMDCSPPGSSVHGIFSGNNTGVDCHFLLRGIFPAQESNPGLLHYRQILYRLSYEGSP